MLAVIAMGDRPAFTYEGAGHYHSIAILTSFLKPPLPQIPPFSQEESALLALCAQLPDKATELDAVQVYKSLLLPEKATEPNAVQVRKWQFFAHSFWNWLFGDYSDPAVRRMMTVQQLLHGLTGGNAKAVQEVAQNVIKDRVCVIQTGCEGRGVKDSGDLCALGFALHLYGDSFAHKQLVFPADHMYPTGRGHATDLSYPDYPLYEEYPEQPVRLLSWHNYLQGAPGYLGKYTLDPSVETKEVQQVLSLSIANLSDGSEYGEQDIKEILFRRIGKDMPRYTDPPDVASFSAGHSPCQDYLNDVFDKQKLFKLSKPQCKEVWLRFRAAAETVFRNTPGAIDPDFHDVEYLDPF